MPPASRAQGAPPKGVTARAFSAGGLPTLQPVTAFALFFFLLVAYPFGCRRFTSQRVCEDGGGVAVAGVAPKRRSSPALCTAATPGFPRPPSRLQAPPGPLRASGRLTPAPVRPQGAPCLPPGHAGRPLRGDRPTPPADRAFPLPEIRQTSLCSDCRISGFLCGMPASRLSPPEVGDKRPRALFLCFGGTFGGNVTDICIFFVY